MQPPPLLQHMEHHVAETIVCQSNLVADQPPDVEQMASLELEPRVVCAVKRIARLECTFREHGSSYRFDSRQKLGHVQTKQGQVPVHKEPPRKVVDLVAGQDIRIQLSDSVDQSVQHVAFVSCHQDV